MGNAYTACTLTLLMARSTVSGRSDTSLSTQLLIVIVDTHQCTILPSTFGYGQTVNLCIVL